MCLLLVHTIGVAIVGLGQKPRFIISIECVQCTVLHVIAAGVVIKVRAYTIFTLDRVPPVPSLRVRCE